MILRRRAVATFALALLTPAISAAAEVQVAGKPLQIDVTNTAIGNLHFDNKNTLAPLPRTQVDDDYKEFIDRLNVQLSYWRFSVGARIDGYAATRLSDTDVDAAVAKDTINRSQTLPLKNAFLADLNSRYLATLYPSKLWVTYQQRSVEATAGDFYVQLGRGMVFSVRKIDELSIDTTVRGGKLAFERDLGPVHVDLLGFAGEMNPLRIDEVSGRRLNVLGNDPLFFGFPTANELRTTQLTQTGSAFTVVDSAAPNYLEDRVFGGRLEIGPKQAHIGFNGVLVSRKQYDQQYLECVRDKGDQSLGGSSSAAVLTQGLCNAQYPHFASEPDVTRQYNTIRGFSASLNVPSIWDHGDLYVEVAGQQLRDGQLTTLATKGAPEQRIADRSGYGVYVAASGRSGPFTATFEGKHYRSLFPIAAHVNTLSPSSAGPEFSNVAYSQAPTAQSIYIEPATGAAPNNCITGGRGVVNYRFTPKMGVSAWVGRFASWSEFSATNFDCATKDDATGLSNETDTWDVAAGTEMFFEHGKSKVVATIGAIDQTLADAHAALGGPLESTWYREGYLRYDVVKHIKGPFSIQFQGWHRRRYEPYTKLSAWSEGENYTALQWSPHISAIFGFEYVVQDACEPGAVLSPAGATIDPTTKMPTLAAATGAPKNVCLFYNGQLQWRSNGSGGTVGSILDTVNLYVGERRGAIRCVSGVCRQFPPFSGAKIEVVSRF